MGSRLIHARLLSLFLIILSMDLITASTRAFPRTPLQKSLPFYFVIILLRVIQSQIAILERTWIPTFQLPSKETGSIILVLPFNWLTVLVKPSSITFFSPINSG